MVKLIGPGQLPDFLNRRDVLVIDLRDMEEYEKLRLNGAIHMTYDRCVDMGGSRYKKMIILIYCHKGNLSLKAGVKLDKKGYNVYSVAGGFEGIKAFYGN